MSEGLEAPARHCTAARDTTTRLNGDNGQGGAAPMSQYFMISDTDERSCTCWSTPSMSSTHV